MPARRSRHRSTWSDLALEEFEDLNPVVVPGVSCFNAGLVCCQGLTSRPALGYDDRFQP